MVIIVSTTPLEAQTLANPHAKVTTSQVYQLLATYQMETDHCIMLGQNIGWSMEEFDNLVADLASQTGVWPGLIGGQLRPFPDEIDYDALLELTVDWHQAGGLVEFSILPNNPFTGGDAWDISQHNIRDLVSGKGQAFDNWRTELDFYASFLQKLQENEVPVLWRPLMEMNGDWFWYGFQGDDDPAPFIALYRDMFNYYTHAWKLNNLIWVYCANTSYDGIPEVDHYYPGDDVTDVVGFDVYVTDLDIPAGQYQKMLALGKPFAVPEFGPSFSDMDGTQNYAAYLATFQRDFPQTVYTIAWHSWPNHLAAWIDNTRFLEAFQEDCVLSREELHEYFQTTGDRAATSNTAEIFPNPVSRTGYFEISAVERITQYRIFDVQGKEIQTNSTSHAKNGIEIQISEPGLFFIHIELNGKTFLHKIIVH